MRLVLDNGVISRPGQYMWSGIGGGQAYENDLAIKSVEIYGDHGLIDSSTEYLAAGMGLNFSIDVGYEGIDGTMRLRMEMPRFSCGKAIPWLQTRQVSM